MTLVIILWKFDIKNSIDILLDITDLNDFWTRQVIRAYSNYQDEDIIGPKTGWVV